MKLFFAYLKEKRASAAAFLVCTALFGATFALYRLPPGAVVYPALLSAAALAGFFVFGFVRTARRHRRLVRAAELPSELMTDLPEPAGVEGADCRAIIESLRREAEALRREAAARERDAEEYYTLWVHQIKTPIASMRLNLQSEDTPASRRLSLDLSRIERYVDMVLAYTRLGSDSHDYVFREQRIDAVVRAAAARLSTEFIARRLSFELEPTDAVAVTDGKWLGFVVEQVLSNSLKYTREGGIRAYMRGKTLYIDDIGIGIAPEDLPRVFEKSYTGLNGRADGHASGLGLYLCRRICRELGAEISIFSEPGKGTSVRIDLSQNRARYE